MAECSHDDVGVQLENVVWDARDPHRLGSFWAAALGAEPLTDEPDLHEARLHLGSPGAEVFLDLCFVRVDPATAGWGPPRLHLDLVGGQQRDDVVDRLIGLGAERADGLTESGQGDVPWTVLADVEGGAFCVMGERASHALATGPIGALPLDSADPERDAAFWARVTGWVVADEVSSSSGATTLRHPDGVGPLLALCPEPEPSSGKNRIHLDVRRGADDGDDAAVLSLLHDLGATSVTAPGERPWLVLKDPSGNEFCVLGRPA